MSKQNREQGRAQRAAAIRAAQARKERNRRVALMAGIVVLLGAVVAAGVWYGGGSADTPTASSTTPTLTAGPATLEMGNPKAPVKVVIYEDFLCPFCRELETETRAFLRENAAKGKVYVEYQPINLLQEYPYSAKALNAWAAVLHNSTPKAALKLHDLLYDNQPYEQSSNQVTDAQITSWVKEAGAGSSKVLDAMKTKDAAFFATAQDAMTSAGVQSTPTVVVNGKQLQVTDVTTMVSQLETAVSQGS